MSAIGKHRRKYAPECRREAARLVIDTGRPIVEVAIEIGVGSSLAGSVGCCGEGVEAV